ncbi:MAG: patatin-like phospholipase family protein [Spirochaetes bacterium]|nr:patatin-like phospholipase family protein [Spirochaetota bacterium]
MFPFKNKTSYCLVLSGGGAKGVYHIGVWNALRKLKIPIHAFIGNSIGAIIAGFLAQGEDKILNEMSQKISIDFILKVPDEFIENGELSIGNKQLSSYVDFYNDIVKEKGLNTEPLRNHLKSNLSETSIRQSGKDLGVVTFNISNLEPREVFIEEMEPGYLIDYLLASSAFPGFKSPEIEGKQYIDGGVYDNIPYAMARKRGYRNIIVVDISGLGMNKKINIQGTNTVYIKNSIQMGGVLDFNREFLDQFMKLGYLDTLRTFGYLKGYQYFIQFNEKEETAFKNQFDSMGYLEFTSITGLDNENKPHSLAIREILPDYMKYQIFLKLALLECAASILKINQIEEYTYSDLQAEIIAKKAQLDQRMDEIIGNGKNQISTEKHSFIESILRKSISSEVFNEPPYYYYQLLNHLLPKKTPQFIRKAIMEFFPELPAGMVYLKLLKKSN